MASKVGKSAMEMDSPSMINATTLIQIVLELIQIML